MLSSSARIPHMGLGSLWIITVCTVTLFSGSLVTNVYGAPAKLDPIAVAVPNDSAEGTTVAPPTIATTTTVDVENAQLVELKSEDVLAASRSQPRNTLPAYLLELNDPDIDGAVDYMPADDGASLKVIAWDLLPPFEAESKINTANSNAHNQAILSGVSSEGSVSVVPFTTSQRGSSYFTTSTTTTTTRPSTVRTTRPTTTRATTTTKRTTTTTTTRRPTRSTTTTRRTTTTARTTATPTTSAPLDPNDFYQLEHGDSYTIPSWLADIDDPELDAAVSYVVPEDINEYNDTISRDILPPFEPYSDLNNIDLPAPAGLHSTSTTTTNRPRTTVTTTTSTRPVFTTTAATTTTTRRPTVSTPRPHWVRAHPTTVPTTSTSTTTTNTQRPNSFDDRFATNHIAQSHESTSSAFPNSKVSTSFSNSAFGGTTTTTQKPRLTTPAQHNFNSFKQNIPTTTADPITSSEVESSQVFGKNKFSSTNPFLPAHNSGTRPFASSANANKFTTTTTTITTTTTTPATSIEESPFDSATLPPWLADFDYPDLGPGVPFVYNAEDSKSDVYNDLLPPSQLNVQTTDSTKPVFITSSPASFNSFQIPSNSANRHEPNSFASASTSTTRNFAFNNFPSKVTTTAKPSSIHNPFAQVPNNNNNYNQEETVTLPQVLFTPPTAATDSNIDDVGATGNAVSNSNVKFFNQQQQPQLQPAASADQIFTKKPFSSSFNKNFAAPFESTTAPGNSEAAASTEQDFGSSTKTTFTKSNEGKVITNNVFGSTTSSVTAPTKQFGFSTSTTAVQKGIQQNTFSSSSSFGSSSSSFNKPSTPSGFSTFSNTQQSTATNIGAGKYTGGFGGSPGVLSNGKVSFEGQSAVSAPTAAAAKPNFANRIGVAAPTGFSSGTGAGVDKFQGTFGGPPGVLVPFDNVKSG